MDQETGNHPGNAADVVPHVGVHSTQAMKSATAFNSLGPTLARMGGHVEVTTEWDAVRYFGMVTGHWQH